MKLLPVVLAILALAAVCARDVHAGVIHVPAEYPTISSAVASANPGDTILVAAGVYNEHVVINVANLTLLGAQAGVDARTRSFVPANESIITFATPTFGTGIVNVSSPNVIINGFTVQGTGAIVNSTAAIFAGDAGQFLPSTSTVDVTGLQLLCNIVQDNANGILIASIEPTPKSPNYLVQYNYFQNNSGDAASGNGQGAFFSNSAGSAMTNVTVTENLFNGMETGAAINLSNITTATVSANVLNQDNAISLFGTSGVAITGNATSGATATNGNVADAIFIGFSSSNTTISGNRIDNASSSGIEIYQGNSNLTISDNCVVANTLAGVSIGGAASANSSISITNNNIQGNSTGLNLNAGSYSAPTLLDASSNYWNSTFGPNYNGTSPGAGDFITDNNIPATQSVAFTPFLTSPIACPSPVALALTPTTLPSAEVSAAYSQTIGASGGTAGYTYAVTSGALPPSLSLSSAGVLSGTPSADGVFNFTVTATDSSTLSATGPNTGSQTYALQVTAPTITLSPDSMPATTVADTYNQPLSASGGTAPYHYAVSAGALPAGLTLSSSGVISGTSTAGGTFDFQVTATDSSAGTGPYTGSQTYTLQVNAPTITLAPSILPASMVAAAYSQTISANGATGPYRFEVTAGALPTGMTLSSSGVLSGLATAGGTFTFSVTATDSSTGTGPYAGTQAYSLQVAAATQTLSITAPASIQASQRSTTVTVSASSGLPVALTSASPSVCEVAGAAPAYTVSVLGPGLCTLVASQAGNANVAAVSTTFTLAVLAAVQPAPSFDDMQLSVLALLLVSLACVRLRSA